FEEYPWETAVFWEALDRFPKIVSFKLETEYSLKVREHLTTKSSSTELRNSIRVACPTVTHVTIKSLIEGDLFGFAGEIAYDWVEATGQWGIASIAKAAGGVAPDSITHYGFHMEYFWTNPLYWKGGNRSIMTRRPTTITSSRVYFSYDVLAKTASTCECSVATPSFVARRAITICISQVWF
ncbi:hypothetical protein FA15DRAFT_662033, partial [Coprinopsis marcescibilis]